MNVPLWAALPALGFAIVAAQADVRTRKIPNSLTFPAILLGLLTHLALAGREGFLASLAGHPMFEVRKLAAEPPESDSIGEELTESSDGDDD